MSQTARPHDPASREAIAHREIGSTAIAPPLQWVASLLFLVTVSLVPAVELANAGGSAVVLGAREWAETAWHTLRDRGWIAANRALLAEMSAFEDALDEGSIVAELALPSVQWIQTAWLGVGNEEALLGRDGWMFYRPAVELLTGPGFLDPEILEARSLGGESWEPPPRPDPRPAILATRDDLAERGIELVLLPVPVKASIHPGRLSRRVDSSSAPLANRSWEELLAWAEAEEIPVFDPTSILVEAARATGEDQFLERDTHWTPEAMERVAAGLGEKLEEEISFARPEGEPGTRREARVAYHGDLVEMLRLPEENDLFSDQTVTIRPVVGPDGALWRPDPEAEILLLGDSFANVFSTTDLGWGAGAGLAEQLSVATGRPVDRIARNAGGANGAREALAAFLAGGDDRLAGKRVVVWEFSARELASGDWREVGLGLGPAGGAALPETDLGEGFVIWESNRTGDWRLFVKQFGEEEARQVSPDEPGMQHCCPHVSPDGRWVAYLSRPVGKTEYPEKEEPGPLRLLDTRDWSERTIVPSARNYGWGNRAVVWRDEGSLVYIDGRGRTGLLDVESGESRLLISEPREEMGWLLDPTLEVATNAAPVFAPYDREARRVAERASLGGCEPYFTHDGRWGYWVAGAGGPLNRIDLATREISTILGKNDPRLDPERRYLYFTMTSRDGRLLAWGASDGDHNHFTADYDVYVAPADPETLEPTGKPVRITDHPATDRYPDAFLAPLPLGRHRGEAPFTVRFEAPEGRRLVWSVDGRRLGEGARVSETFREPGAYRIEARHGESAVPLVGRVVVDQPAPPAVAGIELREGGREVVVRFSEPVAAGPRARVELDPEGLLGDWELAEDGRRLRATLEEELRAGGRIRLHGFSDRAQEPNPLPAEWVEIAPPTWPSVRQDLAFLWQTDARPNLVFDPRIGAERAFPLEAVDRAYLDHAHALVLDGGAWVAPEEAGSLVVAEAKETSEVSVELTLTPREVPGDGHLLTLAGGEPHLILAQRGSELVLRIMTSEERNAPPIPLGTLEAGERRHLVVSYSPSNLAVYLDGERVETPRAPRGHLNRWREARLLFGDDWGGGARWRGTLEGIAIWGRALSPAEAREEHVRYRRVLSGRPEVSRRIVEAELVAKSPIPTLAQISPYRVALVVYEYRIAGGESTGETLRVAHWAILDGKEQPVAGWSPGRRARLRLEPFAANPQLEPHFVSDAVGGEGELWYAVGD